MTYGPANTLSSYLPTEFLAPQKFEEFRDIIMRRESLTANIVNTKESGIFDTAERLNGQQWFSTASGINKPRYAFRKVINFGALPNTATKSVAHGITMDANTIMTQIYGCATDPNTSFLPLPYSSDTATSPIELYVDTTNVNIITKKNYSMYTVCYVVLELIQGG